MRISEAAAQAGVGVQTLRYYERRGLLRPPARSDAGYRVYEPDTLLRIRFIRRTQDLGFTLEDVRDLLSLQGDSVSACASVERRASAVLGRIEDKLADLRRIRVALTQYVGACRTSAAVPHCPLLAALGGEEDAHA